MQSEREAHVEPGHGGGEDPDGNRLGERGGENQVQRDGMRERVPQVTPRVGVVSAPNGVGRAAGCGRIVPPLALSSGGGRPAESRRETHVQNGAGRTGLGIG